MREVDFKVWRAHVDALLARSHDLQVESRIAVVMLERQSRYLRACLDRNLVALKKAKVLCASRRSRTTRVVMGIAIRDDNAEEDDQEIFQEAAAL